MSKTTTKTKEPKRPKLLLPNRVRQFEAGRIRPCAECAYCVPVKGDEINGECRRLAPLPDRDGTGYSVPVVPMRSFFCGVFLNRDAALYGDAESVEED